MPITQKKKNIQILSKKNATLKSMSPEKKEFMEKNVSPKKLKTESTTSKSVSESLMTTQRYNEKFIKVLGEFAEIMTKKGEAHRAKAYSTAEETIMKYPDDITDIKQIKNLPGIGSTIYNKLDEYVKTGSIAALERERNDPMNILCDVYGIGPSKAKELINKGITSISQLRDHENLLNDKQKIGLKYYDNIKQRIPRKEITEFAKLFAVIFDKYAPPDSTFEIVGSYRRKKEDSGDIDIIITNKNNDKDAYENVLNQLIKDKIIIEVLSKGKTKSLTLVQIDKDYPIRRVDFLYTSPEEYAFALFYFTGSKIFNTVIRQRAVDLGYTLNEHGLHYFSKGVKGKKVGHEFPSEKSIKNFLGVAYVEPENRIDGRSIVLLEGKTPSPNKDIDEKELLAALESTKTPSPKKDTIEDDFDDTMFLDALEELNVKDTSTKKTKKNITLKKTKDNSEKLIDQFLKDGILALQMMSEKELTSIIQASNNAYYCEGYSLMTDSQYDIIRDYTTKKYPKNKIVNEGHASCEVTHGRQKVKLPYELWSMDKIKPDTDALAKWKKKYKGPYIISAKLDGISALYINKDGESKLYTRGNGKYGQDISHLIPYIINIDIKDVAIRGEIIITKDKFDKKYSKQFANSRNFVAGMVNKKTIDTSIIKDLNFVAYEVISPELKPSDQMKFLKENNILEVINVSKNEINNENLSEELLKWRESYAYQVDGVVVVNDKIYPRSTGNPEHAFAFKMIISDQIAEAKVVDVLWTPSKDGYLSPRVQIEPITLGGATIQYATGKNAKFIVDNNIGVGAIITIIRSGEVIPDIINVVEGVNPKLPDLPFKWNETHTDIILDNKDDDVIVKTKNILGFFKILGVEGIGPGSINKLFEAGYDSVSKIIAMKPSDFLTIEGFQEKTANKFYNGIHEKLDKVSLSELMTATNVFGRGFGNKIFERILNDYPDILVSGDSNQEKIKKLIKVDGIAKKTAESFVSKIGEFIIFLADANLEDKLYQDNTTDAKDSGHILYGKKIVLTGFRDKELQLKLNDIGVDLTSSVTKNTYLVIVRDDKDETTGKADQARKLEIPIMTKQEFESKFKL